MQVAFFVFSTIFNFQFLNFKFQILNSFIAALVVMFPILLLWVITKGKGMGFGDVKLAFNIGFLLGLKPGLLALYLAFIAGGVVGFFLLISRKSKLESKIAFGPFIVVGTLIMFFWGEKIMEMIKRIYGF
jgi:leader peptidase (prepilin peptidase)/N-methyltransferase